MAIQLKPKYPIKKLNISCVYRIWIGSKFYIGRSKDLEKRIYCHNYDLNRHLIRYEEGIINLFYQHMVKHIADNNITIGYYEILAPCKDEDERVLFEQILFNESCDDFNCLNYGFESFPYKIKDPVKPLTNKQQIAKLKKTLKSIENITRN